MQRIALTVCVAALTLFSNAHAQIYKWTDAQGRVHYSDEAPEGVDAVEVSERLKEAATIYTPPSPAPRSGPPLGKDGKPMREIFDGDVLVLGRRNRREGRRSTCVPTSCSSTMNCRKPITKRSSRKLN